jgi:hypothetical protein
MPFANPRLRPGLLATLLLAPAVATAQIEARAGTGTRTSTSTGTLIEGSTGLTPTLTAVTAPVGPPPLNVGIDASGLGGGDPGRFGIEQDAGGEGPRAEGGAHADRARGAVRAIDPVGCEFPASYFTRTDFTESSDPSFGAGVTPRTRASKA